MTSRGSNGRLVPLCAAIAGVFVSVAVLGRSSDEKQSLQRQREDFVSMSPDQQNTIRQHFEALKNQSAARQSEIEKIHAAVSQDQSLEAKLDDFFHWWTALPQFERNQFKDLAASDRLAFVKAHSSRGTQLRPDITIEFPGAKSLMFPTLFLSFDEYWAIISETLKQIERPASLESDLAELQGSDQKALRLTMWMFLEYLPSTKNGDQFRAIGDSFADSLQANVHDKEWLKKFVETRSATRERRFGDSWLRMMSFIIIDRCTLALGHSLQEEFPVSDRQIVDAFSNMNDKALQYEMMKMSSEEAQIRLRLLAQSSGGDTAVQRLLSQYSQFSAERGRLMRMPLGFGDPFGGGPKGGPGSRNPPPDFRGGREEFDRRDRKGLPEPPPDGFPGNQR